MQVAQMGYGLTVHMVRELAWQVAVENNLPIPENWKKECKAGIDWFHGFKKRHPVISIRVPEACSIARAMAFNKTNVEIFFNKLEEVLLRSDSFKNGSRIYNLDETCTSTVQNQRKIVSPKGVKQVHQIKGAERGTSVTTCVIIGAFGVVLPPVLIFPRKKRIPDLMINAFPGSLGLGNEKGYMTKESFFHVMEHFINCTKSSKQNPTLLLLDNVETHFSTKTLNLAKENGVVIFTFPPHCTHRLQPLDVGIFGPFKVHYDNAINSYLMNNPASPPTLYRIAGFVKEALCKAVTPHNIIKSFETTGIFPFNRNVFQESDFIMASVTEKLDSSKADSISSPEIMTPTNILVDITEEGINTNKFDINVNQIFEVYQKQNSKKISEGINEKEDA
ncbi:uncharacterized protein LOC120356784 [Solenopsis invicta]|uniref:uncharacterized protein LOC120356784 n=1 Tax=Solenopsis invicta TaxID=13686 RepID=UPI00193E6957|nr:uncharacterized protein LOC120356784 [Solenopsis invicta]